MSGFDDAVAAAVRAIPRGQTRSYAQVAMYANRPGAARAVVQALQRLGDVPWWRVIRADGSLAAQGAPRQVRHLRAEGVALKRVGGRWQVAAPSGSLPGRS